MGKGESSQSTQQQLLNRKQLKFKFKEARNLYDTSPIEYFPGSTVAERSPFALEGIQQQAQLGRTGSESARAGRLHDRDVLGGKFLDPDSNPNLRKTYDRAAGRLTETFNRTAATQSLTSSARGRRIGGSSHESRDRMSLDLLGDQLEDLATGIYGGAYQQERGLMSSAAGRAPQQQATEYEDIRQLRAAGGDEEQYAQRIRSDEVARFEHDQAEKWKRLGLFSELIGAPVNIGTQTSAEKPFDWGRALGGLVGLQG